MFDTSLSKNPIVAERRLGVFRYTHEFLTSTPAAALKNFFSKVIPTSVVFDYATQQFQMIAFSADFESVPLGYSIPLYQPQIRGVLNKKTQKTSYYVKFILASMVEQDDE